MPNISHEMYLDCLSVCPDTVSFLETECYTVYHTQRIAESYLAPVEMERLRLDLVEHELYAAAYRIGEGGMSWYQIR